MSFNPSLFLSILLIGIIICFNSNKTISKPKFWSLIVVFLFLLNHNYPFITLKKIEKDVTSTFFVAGHVYGNPKTRRENPEQLGLYPVFLETIKKDIIKEDIEFGFFTGDMVYRNNKSEWDAFDKDIANINIPVHLVPGNHDVANKQLFYNRYIPNGTSTYKEFSNNGDLFIILDPNIDQWNINGPQLEFLKNSLKNASEYKNIFVFFHQILWWEKGNKYKLSYLNSRHGRAKNINFWSEVEPLFKQLKNNVYMFAGDTGVAKYSLPSYDTYDNIHFIASGMGGGVNDNYVKVDIINDADHTVDIKFIWLNDRNKLENYIPYK